MDDRIRRLIAKALDLDEDADENAVESALEQLGVEGGRLFTQEEVNTLLGANKRHLRAENERLQREITEAAETLAGLAGEEHPGDTDLIGRIERASARIAELERDATEAVAARTEAQTRMDEGERDRALLAAAGRAGMIDPEGEGLPFFRDRVRCDDQGRWRFVDDDGEGLPLQEGLSSALASRRHLVRPQLAGGAGTGAPGEADAVASAIERLRRAGRSATDGRDDRSLFELAEAVLEVGRARRGT